jgi:hypothetical protein
MVIMVSHLAINMGVMPLFSIQVAMNKVRWPGIVTLIMGIGNLALAIFLAKYASWGIFGVAVAGAIVLTAKNALFTPIYGAIILDQPWHTFLKSHFSSLAFLAGLLLMEYLLEWCIQPLSVHRVIVISVLAATFGMGASWFMLSEVDRRSVGDLVPARFRSLLARLTASEGML